MSPAGKDTALVEQGVAGVIAADGDLGQPGLVLDASAPKVDVGKFMANETRFRMLDKTNPERAKMLLELAREQVASRWAIYENLARGVDPVAAVTSVQAAPKTN